MVLTFAASALVVGFAMSAMALGAMLRGRPLRHGCGEADACEGCGRPCPRDATGEETTWSET